MNYWEERAKDSINRMDKALSDYSCEVTEGFEKAKKELQDEINKFYGKYAVENKVTFFEAQKQLNFQELKNFNGDLKEYERLARNSIGTYDLAVSNLSKKARITRLQALEMQCDTILQKLYQQQRVSIENLSSKLYVEQYYKRQFDIGQYTGFQFNFSSPSTAAISKMLETPVNGLDISTSLWRQDIDTGFKIRQTLNQMFATGMSPQYFSECLQKIIGRRDENGNLTGKKYEAYRLLYNESAFSTEQATLQAYQDDEIEEYEIIATLDSKTSPICQREDGKHHPIKNAVTGINYPPFHVNCRTTTAPYIPNLKEFKSTRIARDINGKSVRVKQQTYEEWRKDRVNELKKEQISGIIINNNQFGKKVGKHASDFGLDANNPLDRQNIRNKIIDIASSPDKTLKGSWRGQKLEVLFKIKGDDVVILKQTGEFITILKGGTDNARVKNARDRKV